MQSKKTIWAVIIAALAMTGCTNDQDYDATGTFEATEVTISAEVNGRILSFDAEEGTEVKAGETLGVIDTVQFVLQRQQLKMQQQAILAQRPDVQKQVQSLREQIEKTKRERQRIERLKESGAATPKQLDDIVTQEEVLSGQLEAMLQTLNAGSSAAESNAAAIEMQVKAIEDRIARCNISSPVDGTILMKYSQAGEMAIAGKPLMKVANLKEMFLRAYLTSDQLSEVKLGQEVTVIADYGGKKQKTYKGRVAWISAESEFTPKGIQTRDSRANLVYAVKIAVENDGLLKIGLYGEVKL